jgi:uncharacterized membrane protein
MNPGLYLKLFAATAATYAALDLLWLGVIARGLYQAQFGHLMRADTQWLPAIAFYLIYTAAIIGLCVLPAAEKQSIARAAGTGALLGLAAYAAFDLVGLALLKDFPRPIALIDMAWGTAVTAAVSAVGYLVAPK